MAKIQLKTSSQVVPMIYAYTTPEIARHNGWTKIGYTEQDVDKRLDQQSHTIDVIYKFEWKGNAIYDDGSGEVFHDSDFHDYLVKNKINRLPKTEWFEVTPSHSKAMFNDFRSNRGILETHNAIEYTLRPEQEAAANMAHDYFKKHEHGQFLYNAKPRFGKTLTTYDLCKRLKAKNVLIVTNRPAIATSWYDDYVKFLGTQSGYHFISSVDTIQDKPYVVSREEYQRIKSNSFAEFYGCIEFVSLQDLKGSIYFGGKYDKLKEVAQNSWDLLVIDEAHEGIDTYKTDVAFDHIKAKNTLHLSGTPFKALANDKFAQDAIFNWTYADEQTAKRNFKSNPGTKNPYENLPQLNMYTYQLSEIVEQKVAEGTLIDGEVYDYAFDLNEFFSTSSSGKFKYDEDVDKFLDALATQEKFPFSTKELRDELRHTLWLLNRVDSAKALATKLRNHPLFKNYEIVLAAGDGKIDLDDGKEADDKEIRKAYDKVKNAIKSHDYTITLSVGQLTTGVTIPEWSAVLMLSSLRSPALYMQAAFRAQNPCLFHNGKGYYRKRNAYIFDFDPARTLDIYEQIANGLSESTSGTRGDSDLRKMHVNHLLNFFPVIGEDENGEMIPLDAEKVLSIPRKLKSTEVVRHGFMSNFLFQNIGHIFTAPSEIINMISKIEAVEEPKEPINVNPDTQEELSLDKEGEVSLDPNYVIGTAADMFGEKLFDTENISNQLDLVLDDSKKTDEEDDKKSRKSEADLLIETLADKFNVNITDKALEKAKEEYGKDLSKTASKTLERKIKSKTETVVKKAVGDHEIQKKIIEKEREERLADATSHAEKQQINRECDQKKQEAQKTFEKTLHDSIPTLIKDVGETIVKTVETEKREQKKNIIEQEIKDHLRGFSRTIPSFLMAYGTDKTELKTFEKNIPDKVFIEVTSLTKSQFVLLRDGGAVLNKETGQYEPFYGKLFDEVVFNDSVKEFLKKKNDLANYFEEKNKEDIFNYIPPQKTNQIFTPKWVVKEMVDMLEKENPGCFDNPDYRFADLYMKSGMYMAEIVTRLYRSEKMKQLFPDNRERLIHIFSKQVYGCAPTEIIHKICVSYLLGFSSNINIGEYNIKRCDTLKYAKEGKLEEELVKLFGIKPKK